MSYPVCYTDFHVISPTGFYALCHTDFSVYYALCHTDLSDFFLCINV